MTVQEMMSQLDVHTGERDAAKMNTKEPFDMLIVGGGPAGAAAAVCAARKGIRVGVAAERFGRQSNIDAMAIENCMAFWKTTGPRSPPRCKPRCAATRSISWTCNAQKS